MTQTKNKPRVGDRVWFVEWVTKLGLMDPDDPDSDVDRDSNEIAQAECATEAEAMAKAKEVYPLDQYGSVRYCEALFVPYDPDHVALFPHAGFWVDSGEAAYYEGED